MHRVASASNTTIKLGGALYDVLERSGLDVRTIRLVRALGFDPLAEPSETQLLLTAKKLRLAVATPLDTQRGLRRRTR
jgi:hypothetical protein